MDEMTKETALQNVAQVVNNAMTNAADRLLLNQSLTILAELVQGKKDVPNT